MIAADLAQRGQKHDVHMAPHQFRKCRFGTGPDILAQKIGVIHGAFHYYTARRGEIAQKLEGTAGDRVKDRGRFLRSEGMDTNPDLPPIHIVHGHRVMLDSDLAKLYSVPTKVFNQSIRRNMARFPSDFLFHLTPEELADVKSQSASSNPAGSPPLRSQIVTLKTSRRGRHRKYLPLVFTEHGAIMAASVLRSPRAVAMSVYVVRAFVRMREELLSNAVFLQRLAQVDKKLLEHDVILQDVIEKLLPLLNPPPEPAKRRIGFHRETQS